MKGLMMDWFKPKRALGTTLVSAGPSVKCNPKPLADGFGWLVMVELTETAPRNELMKTDPPSDDVNRWPEKKLTRDLGFVIDERARGTITHELPGGEVVVHFASVPALVGDRDIE
jgi:hypothetical protein